MISKEEVLKAQQDWLLAVIKIGELKENPEECEREAKQTVDKLYAYEQGPVLFKPTLASERPFRHTREGALSYFIGGNTDYPEDHGFALRPWVAVRFENSEFILEKNRAIVMGEYFFSESNGDVTKVEYTFGYIKDEESHLKIDLHHSSLPFSK